MRVDIVRPPAAEVSLLSWTKHPVETLVQVCSVFQGASAPTIETQEELDAAADSVLAQLQKTALQGPLEMINFVFLIERVSRAFTHQLVRYRIGTSFAQESLRFTDKTECEVLATTEHAGYAAAVNNAIANYEVMLQDGVPVQDARGVLPTNILTKIYMSVSLRTVINMWKQRMCTQAQHGEWEVVLRGMAREITRVDGRLIRLLQLECQLKGECLFHSTWDRPCPVRDGLNSSAKERSNG